MATEPIRITLYGENDEAIDEFQKNIIPWGMLKKALKMQDVTKKSDEKTFDVLGTYVCELFGNKFTLEQLEKGADISEVIAVITEVTNRASALYNDPN